MSYFVYILYSEKTGRLYTGQTQDFITRLARHNAGMEKSTRAFAPWMLAVLINVNSRAEAMKLEKQLKARKDRKQMIALALKSGGVAGSGWTEAMLQRSNRESTD